MEKKVRLLIVDDEPEHLLALQMIFGRFEDFEIFSAKDTTEADLVLESNEVDVILLDIALPGEDGLDFCRRLKNRPCFEGVPILAVSAYPDYLWQDKADAAGCTGYINKPFDPDKLVETVRDLART